MHGAFEKAVQAENNVTLFFMDISNNEESHTEWIDRYLQGDLEKKERERFAHRLQHDEEFRREVEMQQAIAREARKIGREAFREELKELGQRLDLPWPEPTTFSSKAPTNLNGDGFKQKPFWFTIRYQVAAAAVLLLLATAALGYWYYARPSGSSTAREERVRQPQENNPQLALIPWEIRGKEPDLGFSGSSQDSSIAVLIYPEVASGRTYQFDDTLRLHGHFTPSRLRLLYDREAEQYRLREGTTVYPLQRYHSRQPLQPSP